MILDKKQIQVIFLYKERKWKWSLLVVSGSTWAAAYQAPPSMGFSRQEYWSGVPFPSPKSVETTCNVNNTFGPAPANKRTVQWWFK